MESQVQQVVICADENVEQNSCLSSPPPLKLKPRGRKRRKRDGVRRLGRPFDRNVRAAAWEKGGALLEESMFGKLKKERETARRNCSLRCLSLKDQQRPSSMRFDRHRRLQALNFFNAPLKVEMMAGMSDVEQIKEYEVILWIEVVRPTTRQKGQHFLVLGSQMLTTLRDKIYCLTDKLMQKLNYFLPSGYFCIENVFYNDMRDPDAIDYSDPILKWMHYQGSKGLCNPYGTRAADMATTSFLDLEFRVGKQYTYCHQGNCKHMLMIRDMRLIHKEDVQNALLYPLLRSPFRVHLRKCTICAIYIATKVTVDDKMAPESPCFYCDYCYYVQHYSQDGRLLYNDFRVYDYYHE
ncbi:hypothetical protein KP509_09G053200 [Ceratopteris richardii]|nr:hypothetical protein KP509_09G053200 [Ceratopteris richardii]